MANLLYMREMDKMPATTFAANPELRINLERFEILDALIDGFIQKEYKQFFVVRAHRFGVPVYEHCAGENTKPYGLTQDSITPVFSCTKPITAVLIMKLQEDGLLDVCDPVVSYLPWMGEGKEGIQIWHLLTHTSGIIDEDFFKHCENMCEKYFGLKEPEHGAGDEAWKEYGNKVKEKAGLSADASRDEVDHYFLARFTPTKAPHEIMSYGMTGFNLLGDIITAVTGKTLEEYAREVLFSPLGMTNSHFIVPKDKYDQVIGRKEGMQGVPWINSESCMNNMHAQNGLKTTVVDLCRFGDMVLAQGEIDGKIYLSPASIREMSDNHNADLDGFWNSWGLGWNVRGKKKDDAGILRSATSLEHGGWAGAKMICDPVYDLSLAIFSGEPDPVPKYCLNNIINVIYSAMR